jgi:hypothetical protein
MFYTRTLTALTALFMSTSASLLAMELNEDSKEEKKTISFSNPSPQKTENLEKEIFEIISKHNIGSKELESYTHRFLETRYNELAKRAYIIRECIFRTENPQNISYTVDEKKNWSENIKFAIEKEIFYHNNFIKLPYFKKSEKLFPVHSGIITAFSELYENLKTNTDQLSFKNFILKEFASLYGNNSFYHTNSFVEKLKDPSFCKKSLEMFPIERSSFDLVKDLYENSFQGLEQQQEIMHFNYFNDNLSRIFPNREKDIKIGLEALDQESMLKGTAVQQSIKKACTLFSLFKEDKEEKLLPLTYYLITRFLSKYGTPQKMMLSPIIQGGNDIKTHMFTSYFVIKKALDVKPHLKSLPLFSLALRSLSNMGGALEKYKNTKNFSATHFFFQSGVDGKVLNPLAQKLIKETEGNVKKQQIFMEPLQTAIICLGMLNTALDEKEFIELLSSVKYDVNPNLKPEDQQNFRKLEILRNISLYNLLGINLKKTKEQSNDLTENRLCALENVILYLNDYKKASKELSKKELINLLSLDYLSHVSELLSPKNQLAKKYDLLAKLDREEEAEKVYQEYKKEVVLLKERKEKEREEKKLLKSQKKTLQSELIKQSIAFKKHEKEELEKLHQQSQEFVKQNKKFRNLESQVNSPEISTTFNPQEDKFIFPVIKEKLKKKGEVDQNRVQEKEGQITKKPVETSNNKEPKQEEENSKESAYSKKAEEKLSGTAKDILDALFRPYYGEIKWKQLEIPQRDIETLLDSADFELRKPKSGSSHHKVHRKGESNHLLPIPIHGGRIKVIYLRLLSELLAREGFYLKDLKEKLEKDKII